MKEITAYLSTGVAIGLLTFGFAYALISSAALPDVWYSYSTGECVKVLNYIESDEYSCENLPNKFHHVWVE